MRRSAAAIRSKRRSVASSAPTAAVQNCPSTGSPASSSVEVVDHALVLLRLRLQLPLFPPTVGRSSAASGSTAAYFFGRLAA